MNSVIKLRVFNKLEAKNLILNVSSFLLLWILFGFNTYNSDYGNYELIYNIIANTGDYLSSNIEIGFKYIMKFFIMLNLNYQMFLIVYSFICLIIFYKGISRFTNKIYIVSLLFLFYPFFQYILAIRLMFSLSLIINAIYYLKEKELKNMIKYSFLILCASLVHQTSIVYLILLLTYFDEQHVILISIIMMFITIVALYIPFITQFIENFFPKFLIYIKDGTNPITIIIVIAYYISSFLLIRFTQLKYYNNKYKNDYLLIKKIFYLMVIFVPLVYVSMDFFRLFSNITVFIYIIMSNHILFINGYTTKKKLIIFTIFAIFLIIQNFTFGYLNNFESQILPIILNNLLW